MLALVLLACLGLYPGQAARRWFKSSSPLLLTTQPSASVVPSVRIFDDPQKNLTFQEVLKDYAAGGGTAVKGKKIAVNENAEWIVFPVENGNPVKSHWMLDLGQRGEGTSGIADRIVLFSGKHRSAHRPSPR